MRQEPPRPAFPTRAIDDASLLPTSSPIFRYHASILLTSHTWRFFSTLMCDERTAVPAALGTLSGDVRTHGLL